MSIHPIENSTVTDTIIQKLESMIVEGVYKPGESLPPERQLAKNLEVSRPSLRQGLSVLEARGLVRSRQGGGNYVCDVIKSSLSDPLINLMSRHQELKFDIIELRQALEGDAAYYAAQRATEKDKDNIKQKLVVLQEILPKRLAAEEAKADLDLHLAIADASHNTPLSLMLRNIYTLLLSHMERLLVPIHKREQDHKLLQIQHVDLVNSILGGDAEGAQRIVKEHLKTVSHSIIETEKKEKRNQRSSIRAVLASEVS